MTLPIWPNELPAPSREDYTLAVGETRRFAAEDAGPPRLGRKFSRTAEALQMSILVDRDGRAVFENFFNDTLKGGSLPFLMPDAGTDGWSLTDENGEPLTDENDEPILLTETWLCLFGSSLPQRRPRGVNWQISFSISVLP